MDQEFILDQWKKLKEMKAKRADLSKRIKQIEKNVDQEIDPEGQLQVPIKFKPEAPKPAKKAPKKKAAKKKAKRGK